MKLIRQKSVLFVNQFEKIMDFSLHTLPYKADSLAPFIGEETINCHFGKHTKAYVDNVNRLKAGTKFGTMSLEEIVRRSDGALFNNAAQVWNHYFYFEALNLEGEHKPGGNLLERINMDFGSLDQFCGLFEDAGVKLFGSGWVWLVRRPSGVLAIVPTQNAATPLTTADVPLLCVDVWEHAYYLDYQNRRAEYLRKIWGVIDWNVVESRYERE